MSEQRLDIDVLEWYGYRGPGFDEALKELAATLNRLAKKWLGG